MRARLVRPEFWSDSVVGKMPDPVRLLYIGLWGLADDAGYLEWDTTTIAITLQAYQKGSVDARVRRVEEWAQVLIAAGRVQLLGCGKHATIPTLERHRIAGGNKSESVKKVHDTEPAGRVRTPTDRSPQAPKNGAIRTSTYKSRSESPSPSLSESESPSPPRRGNGSKDPKNEEQRRAEAIARAQAKLEDPDASEGVKDAARFSLTQLGVTP